MRLFLPVAALMVAIPALAAGQSGQRGASVPTLAGLSKQYEDLVEKVDPAVVQIITRGIAPASEDSPLLRTRSGSGSGVIVDPAGYIVTNAHVVGLASEVRVLLPQEKDPRQHFSSILKPAGKSVPAKVIGVDRETDIAVLKIESDKMPSLPFADSEALRQGQIVFAFGSPFGLENSVSIGVISSVARQVRPDDTMVYIQTDAAINPGNSGGPLVNPAGEIVGINTFIVTASGGSQGVGFAAPSHIVKSIYDQIRREGRVRRGQMGVVPQTITPELAKALNLTRDWGVILSDIKPRGSAEAAGLQLNDIVLTYNGKTMENARQFGVNIYRSAGETVTLEILRGSENKTIKVAILERPQDPERLLSAVAGDVNRVPRLGILAVDLDERVTPLFPDLRKLSGAVVAGLTADLSVHESGFERGDVIYAVNKTPVRGLIDLKSAVANLKSGDVAAVHVERDGLLRYLLLEID